MIDRDIRQERYRETKEIVDEVIVDGDYERHAEPYYDPSITMLEVLRIMFAYNLAKRYKSLRSREQITTFIDPRGIRDWLEWVHRTRNGGVDNGYGYTIETPESYSESPGIARWTHFGVHMADGIVSGPGRTTLWFNRITGSFQETPCRMDDEMIRDLAREARSAAGRVAPEGLVIPSDASIAKDLIDRMVDQERSSLISLRMGFEGTGGPMLINHSPFSFEPIGIGRNAMLSAYEAPRLEDLRRRVQAIVELARWPEDVKREILLSVDKVPNGGDSRMLRAGIVLRFTQPDHMLVPRVVDQHLGSLDYDPKWTPTRILSEFDSKMAYVNQTLAMEIEKDCRREADKTRRRRKKASDIGEGNLLMDHVARHMLGILAQHDEAKHAEVMAGRAAIVKLPLGSLEGFLRGRSPRQTASGRNPPVKRKPRKTETISFSIEEAQMRARFHINDDVYWDRTRLRVGALPEAVLASLPGRPAREVLDHPLADLLGPVKRAYRVSYNKKFCWISFEGMIEKTRREDA